MLQIKTTHSKRRATIALLSVCASALFCAAASAAVVPEAYKTRASTQIVSTQLSAFDGTDEKVLDWRNPSTTLRFDIPEGNWSDSISLKLSATPKSGVSASTPLLVSFNNGKPVPVHSNGNSFDAEVSLSKLRIKPRNNTITITYKTPSGSDCLTENDGAWMLNLERSELIVKSFARERDFRMNEIESRLGSIMSAPDTIAILAKGENAPALQALTAQAIGLRMDTVPEFTTRGQGDVTLHVGTRAQLGSSIKSSAIKSAAGPRIAIDDGRPLSIVITGDTDAEVLAMSQAFASRHLPDVRRQSVSLSEVKVQPNFQIATQTLSGKSSLEELGKTYFERNYRPAPVKLQFSVDETQGTRGELLLNLRKNEQVANTSRVDVTLNGKALGFTQLDKNSKYVAFDLPVGSVKPSNNEIVITPVLDANTIGCVAASLEPGISLGARSALTITPGKDTLSLSRFAASGAPFSNNAGADTTVILSNVSQERGAALAILAKAAKASGTGWTAANFTLAADVGAIDGTHVLMLGTSHALSDSRYGQAPRALTDALRGVIDPRLAAQTVNFAANSEAETIRQYAALTTQKARSLSRGGVAAIYEGSDLDGYAIGVITARSSNGFNSSSKHLTQDEHWDALSGSVVRWDRQSVVMAQAAQAYVAPKSQTTSLSSGQNPILVGVLTSLGTAGSSVKSALTGWSDKLNARRTPSKPEVTGTTLRVTPKASANIAAASPRLKPSAPQTAPRATPKAATRSVAASAIPSFDVPKSLTLRGKSNYVHTVSYAQTSPTITAPKSRPVTKPRQVATTANHSGFNFTYFKANVRAMLTQAQVKTARWTKANFGSDKLGDNTKTVLNNYHIVMLGLIALLAIVLVGFASPASASTRQD